ncbi:MAG: acyl-CoA dehydrogenase family protein [Saprospiraceae bacterium]|nr:acyl-CoA dehydrogenase family protein [Saprospiraceae bacterium]
MHNLSPNLPPAKLNQILENIKVFINERAIPIEKEILICGWEHAVPILENLRNDVRSMGYWLPQIPEAYGGLGLNNHDFGKVSEILGMSPIGHYLFNCQAPDAGNMEILIEFGTDSQKEKFLTPLLSGKIRSCFSMTEPDFAGSDPVLMGTHAVKGEGQYVINGRKWFTSSADGAGFAIVMAITNPNTENPYKRASMIIVPTDCTGFFRVRNITVMGDIGEGYFSHAEIIYQDCGVSVENLLGTEGEGFRIAQTRLGPGRIHHCMRWIGICERAFDMMCKRAISRKLSHHKTISDHQSIRNMIAESRAEINAARLLVLDAAQKIDLVGYEGAKIEISVIKFFVAGVLQKVLDRAVQIHGALGITDDTILSWWYRHERGARIYDGPDEVHKSRVAKEILKSYKTDETT